MPSVLVPVKATLAFISWTGFSFLCHWNSKKFLTGIEQSSLYSPQIIALLGVLLLTACQVFVCLASIKIETGYQVNTLDHGIDISTSSRGAARVALICHIMASIATNYSLAMMPASHTLSIKLMEPLMSALIMRITMKKTLSKLTLFSLLLVIIGSIGFVGDPSASAAIGTGTLMAVISNLLYGIRNVTVKHILKGTEIQLYNFEDYIIPTVIAVIAFTPVLPDYAYFLYGEGVTVVCLVMSSVFHVVYSYISTSVVLNYLSVVGHAVANILKRVLVVILLLRYGGKSMVWTDLAWLLVAAVGLFVYAREKMTEDSLKSPSKATSRFTSQNKTSPVIDNAAVIAKIKKLAAFLTVIFIITCAFSVLNPGSGNTLLSPGAYHSDSTGFNQFSPPSNEQRYERDPVRQTEILPEELIFTDSQFTEVTRRHVMSTKTALGGVSEVILLNVPVETPEDALTQLGLYRVLSILKAKVVYFCKYRKCGNFTRAVEAVKRNSHSVVMNFLSKPGIPLGTDLLKRLSPASRYIFFDPYGLHLSQVDFMEMFLEFPKQVFCLSYVTDLPCYNIPHFGLSIVRPKRFMNPFFDVVWLHKEDCNSKCVPPRSRGFSCSCREWDDPKHWRLPASTPRLIDQVYVNSHIYFMCALRGRMIVTDSIVGHVVAKLFDIPHVIIRASKEEKVYLDSWVDQLEGVLSCDNDTEVPALLETLSQNFSNRIRQMDPARQIVVDH